MGSQVFLVIDDELEEFSGKSLKIELDEESISKSWHIRSFLLNHLLLPLNMGVSFLGVF